MSVTKNKSRIADIDFVRGICILAVHVGHCSIDCGFITYLWQTFFMSAFFIFSGYFSKSYTVKRILKSTLLLYYLWSIELHILMAIRAMYYRNFSITDWLAALKLIIIGVNQPNACAQLWFLIALFVVKLIWYFLLHLFSTDKARFLASAIIAVAGIILNTIGIHNAPFRLITAMIMLPLFVFGHMMSKYDLKRAFEYINPMCLFVLIASTWVLITLVTTKIYGHSVSVWKEEFNFIPIFYCNAVLGTCVFLLLSVIINNTNCKLLTCLHSLICFYGKNSLTAFLTVNMLIILVSDIITEIMTFLPLESMLKKIIICLCVLLLQIPIAKVLNLPKMRKIALLK